MSRFWQFILLVFVATGIVPCEAAEPQPLFRWSRAIDTSSIDQEEMFVLPLDSEIYDKAQSSLNDLVIQNINGDSVPFLIRKQKKKITRESKSTWRASNVRLNPIMKNRLEIEFELKENDLAPVGLKIVTPLKNFEQRLQVFAINSDGTESPLVEDALIFDYSRFMDVRQVSVRFPKTSARKFRAVIDNPTRVQQSQLVEITKRLQEGGEVSSESRTTIEKRPFRMDRIEFWTETETLTQVSNEHPFDVRQKKIVSFPEKGQTGVEILTNGEPLTSFKISTSSKNFQRTATLYEVSRRGSRVANRQLASTRLRRFDFRELNEEHLTLSFPESRHRHFRIVIENHESQPVEIDGIEAFGQLEELVFFAEQNQKYSLLYGDQDAEKVQLDTAALQAALGKKIQPILVTMGVPQERDLSNFPPRSPDFRDYINNPFLIGAVVFIMIAVLARFLYSAAQQIDSASDDSEINT